MLLHLREDHLLGPAAQLQARARRPGGAALARERVEPLLGVLVRILESSDSSRSFL